MALNNRHRLLSGGGVDPSISLSRTSYTPDAAADKLTFTVTSNTDWTISSNQSWCALDVTSGSKGTATATATILSNTGSQRSAVITAVTRKRGIKATLTVVQKGDWITSTTYSIGSLAVSPEGVAAAGGTCQVSGGAGTIVYTWKSGKANTSGTFTPSKSVARTSGSAGGSASIDSAGKVTVKSLSTNYHDGPTVFTVTYSYSPEAPSTGTLSGPAPKTVTVAQAKNVITAVMMGTVSAGAITSSVQYAAGSESGTFANVTAPSISGVTVTFSSGTSATNYSTYGTLSGPSYSWTTSDSGIMTLTSADAAGLSVKSVSRGTTYSASARSATITRTAAYSYSLRPSYNGGSVPAKSASGSCTGTAVQAANHVAVHSVTANAGAITSSVSYPAGEQSKIFNNVTSASAGTCALMFDSGSTTTSGVTTYGAWSGPTYSWLTSDPDVVTLASSNAASLSVTSVDRGTVTGPARSATVTRTAVMTFTLKPDYQTAGRTATKSASASCTGTASQAANTVTYGLPSFKGLRYDKIAPAAGGTAAPKWDLMYQTATYTSGQTVTLTETEMRAASDWRLTQNISSLATGAGNDPEFNNGFTGYRYDNNGSGKTTVERVSSGYPSGIPNNTGYALKITNTGSGTNPGLGGFYLDCRPASLPASGVKLVEITINAWIPKGYRLKMAGNSPGTGGSFRMDTTGEGAGEWRTYAAYIKFGPGASSVGYWYLTGTAGTESAPVTWYVAGVYINQITDDWRSSSATNDVTRPSGSPTLSAAGAITYPTKGTAVSNTVCGDYGGTTFYVVANGQDCFYTLSAYQAENRKTSSNHSPSGYTATISVGSGIGPGTSGTAGTSATVTYSAYHTASDLYSSGSSNNSHTVYDTATVTKTADANSKYTLSGATSGSGPSNTCTLSLPNMTSNTGTWSCTLTCKNGSNSSATKTATASATNTLKSYTGRTISAARSSTSNIAVGGSNAFYATVTSTRRPVYSSGYTGPAADAPFNVYSLTNCTAWSSSSTSGTHYTPSSGLTNGQNVYAHVDANYNTLDSRTVTMYFRQADSESTSTSASWTQNPDTSSLSCYTYDIGLTKSLSSYIPAEGVTAHKDYYVTASVTRTPKYVFDNGGGTYNGAADHGGTLTLAGSNCSFTNSSGAAITTITNGGKAYIKASSNPGPPSSCSSSSRTCSISATAPSDTCAAASKSVTWTQAADSKSWRCDEYEISLEPASTDAIPVAGTPKDDKYKATLSVTRRRYYKWSVGGDITTACSTDNEGTVSISGTNCTCVDPAGTEITSAKNGDVIYITVGNNNHNTSVREVSIDASVAGCSTYTASASWTQSADSEYSCYEYSTSVSRSSSTTSARANSDVTITPKCTSTVKYYWNSDHTLSQTHSSSWQPTYSVTVSGVAGAELRNSSGSKITSLRGGTAGHLYVPDNGGTSSSRTVTISFSDSQSDNCGSSYTSGLTGSTTVTQSGDTVSFVCYKYEADGYKSGNSIDVNGSSGVTDFYAVLTVKKTPKYSWDVAGTTYYGTPVTDTSTKFTVTGDRCTPSDQHGTKLSTVTGGTRIYVSKVTSNAHNESTKNVNLNVFFTEVCDGEGSYIQVSWTQSADSTYTCRNHTTTLIASSATAECAANSDTGLTLDSTYTVDTKWNSDGTVKDYGSTTYTDSSRSFTVSVSGISGAEIRNSSGTRITSMTPSTAACLYVPANGGKSSSRTATISVSASDSENCSSSDSGLTSSVSVKQDGDTTYTHHYDYTVSLKKETTAHIACNAAGYTPGTYATLTARRRPVYYWTVGGTETGDAVWSNVTADITGSNGGWTTATSSSGASAVSTATGGSKLYLMALPNVNTASSRTVSLTASVTDSTGTGVKSATASWTQDGDEKVEKAGPDGKIPRKYSYHWTKDNPDNIPAAGGTRTLTLSATVTKYWYWKYGGDNAGATTENVTDSEAAYYSLYTSWAHAGAKYTATLTRGGSTSDWTSGYMRDGDKITVTAPEWTGSDTRYGGARFNSLYFAYTAIDGSDLADQMWTQDAAPAVNKPSWSLGTTNELLDSNGQGDNPYGVRVSVTDSDSVGWRVMLTAVSGTYDEDIYIYNIDGTGSTLKQFNPTGDMPDTTNVLTSTGSKNFVVSPAGNIYCDRNFTLTLYDAGGTKISSCVFYQPTSKLPFITGGNGGWNVQSGAVTKTFAVNDECSSGWYISTSDSWITSNTASGTANKSISLSVTANTSSNSRTGYVYVRAGSSSTSTLYQTMKVTQAGAQSSAKPSWDAKSQDQTSSGEFAYSVYVTDADRVGWNVKMSSTSSSVKYGMSTTSAAAAKSGASAGAKTVKKTGSGRVYIYADFSSYSGSSDWFTVTLYGPGESSSAAIGSSVRMRWTKGAAQATHRLKVVLAGTFGTPTGSVPSIQLTEYKDGNVNNVLTFQNAGNGMTQNGPDVIFYVDTSAQINVWSSFLNNINGIAGQSMSFQIYDDMNAIWDSEYNAGPCDYQKIGTVVYNLIQTYNSASTTNMKTFTISTQDFN